MGCLRQEEGSIRHSGPFRECRGVRRIRLPFSVQRKQAWLASGIKEVWRREWDSNPRWVLKPTFDFESSALDQLSHLSTWKPEAVVSGLSDTVKNRITVQRHSDAVNVSARPTGRALLPPQIFGSYYEEAHSFPDREAAAAHAPSPAVPSTRNRKRPEE